MTFTTFLSSSEFTRDGVRNALNIPSHHLAHRYLHSTLQSVIHLIPATKCNPFSRGAPTHIAAFPGSSPVQAPSSIYIAHDNRPILRKAFSSIKSRISFSESASMPPTFRVLPQGAAVTAKGKWDLTGRHLTVWSLKKRTPWTSPSRMRLHTYTHNILCLNIQLSTTLSNSTLFWHRCF
jgi:hypothetical protein